MSHTPDWVREDGQFWFDANQPDSDQFSGTAGEWVEMLATQGIRPPQHRDHGGPVYAPEVVIVDVSGRFGSVYRIGGDTLTVFDAVHIRAHAPKHRAA